MTKFVIDVSPHASQRYSTAGDYVRDKLDCIHISVSDMDNRDYEFLVAIHEMVEAYLVYKHGIKEEDIDEFDMNYVPTDSEPGDDTRCPYFSEHQTATSIEKLLAQEMGVSWSEYGKAIDDLG